MKVVTMQSSKTTLEDISAVIGFTATLRLAAWFGDGTGNAYVPVKVEEGQLLVKLIGMPAAKRLTESWGGEHLAVPRLRDYEDDMRKKAIGRMVEHGFGSREIAAHLRISERRVQQIARELEQFGLIPIMAPKKAGENAGENAPEKTGRKNCTEKAPAKMPIGFFDNVKAKRGKR